MGDTSGEAVLRLEAGFLIGVLAVCGVLGAYGWTTAAPDRARTPRPSRNGMEILTAFQCSKPERKVILVRGVEDGFSPVGREPNFIRPGRAGPGVRSIVQGGSYDQSEEDLAFTDSIAVPEGVGNGLFVFSLKSLRGAANDSVMIGNLTSLSSPVLGGAALALPVADLPGQAGWQVDGAVLSARLEDVRLRPSNTGRPGGHRSLLELLKAGGRWIDVMVSDDTSVDFIGVALCVGPPGGKGVTYAPANYGNVTGLALLGCVMRRDDRYRCDLLEGDTPCDTPLPMACIHAVDAAMPARFNKFYHAGDWTGGRLAAAPPTPASRFRTIAEANSYCAANLGKDWRVLSVQDSLYTNFAIGHGRSADFEPRAWVDVFDRPYTTCWARK